MNKRLLFITNKRAFLIFLLVILFLFGMFVLSGGSKSSISMRTVKAKDTTDDIIVQDADSLKKVDMATSVDPNLSTLLNEVPSRIIVEYSNSIAFFSVCAPPAELVNVFNNVTPRITVEYANSTYHHNLEVPPEGFTAVSYISPRIVIEHANSNFDRNLIPAFPDFTMSVTPVSQSTNVGQSATYTVDLTALASFNSPVSLSASGLPTGATASFNPASLTPSGSSTLTISTSSSTPTGSYTITITATGGGITHTENINLIVNATPPSPPQNLSASVSNSSITLTWSPSTQGTYPINGYAIYRGTSAGGESDTPIATVDANTTTYTDTDVTNGTTYYYYVKAYDNQSPANYSDSSDEASATPMAKPTVSTNSASDITSTSATLNGNLTDMGGASSVTVYFEWGTSTSYGNETTHETMNATGNFSADLTDLSPGTTYHFRAVAENSAGTSYGDDKTFTVSSSASLTIHLKGNKFNLVSFPFTVNPSDIPNLVKAYSFDWSDYWQVWTPNGDQDFTTFKPGKGYWIKVSEDEDIPLTGTPAGASNSDVIAPSGAQYGMSITQPTAGSTVRTTSLQVSGTFDTAQPAGYEVILTVTANSQSHQYTYTLPNTQSTWGPITVPASDFDLTTGNSYSAALEAILQDSNGIPVGPPGIDSGTVNFTWKPSSSFPVTITPGKFNLLGVPFNSSIDISALNSANGNHILKIYSFDWTNYWQLWTPNGEQDFTTLEPGKGYWILFDSTAPPTFTFVLP